MITRLQRASQVALVIKSPLANAGELRDVASSPGLGRSPGGGHGNLLQFLPGECNGQRSLVGCGPWGLTEQPQGGALVHHS